MNCAITKHLPCSVCGLATLRHHNWFLAMENRWLDHLKILTWHASLAQEADVKSACGREHLKVLVAYWLEQASLRLASPANHLPVPLAGYPETDDVDLTLHSGGRVIGELSVCREPLSRAWSGSPETLECILDALIPAETENKPAVQFQIYDSVAESSKSRFSRSRWFESHPSESRFSQPRPAPGLALY
jgi:hypothetical protein